MAEADEESVRSAVASPAPAIPDFSMQTHPLDGDIDLTESTGIKAFNRAFEVDADLKRLELCVANGHEVLARVRAKATDCRMYRFFNIPTTGTGVPVVTAATRATNHTNWNALGGMKNILLNHTEVTLEQLHAYAIYNWGGTLTTRAVTDPLELTIERIDPSASPAGLDDEARELRRLTAKQQYRIRSEMLAGILKGVATLESWQLLVDSDEDEITFTSVDGDRKIDGFVLFKKIMMEILPELVVDARDKEKKLEALTLKDTGNNVSVLTRTMETLWKEILRIKPGSYDKDRFMSELFRGLRTSTNKVFLAEVERKRMDWIMKRDGVTPARVIAEVNALYKNLDSEKAWNVLSPEETKIIALTTEIAQAQQKIKVLQTEVNKKGNGTSNTSNTQSGGTKEDWEKEKIWRCKKAGDTLKKNNKEYVWCDKHNGGKGMYMPKPHDHAKWQIAKDEKKAQAKERRGKREKKNTSGTGTGTGTAASTASGKLTLAKNLVEALTTQVGVSDADAKKLAEDILSKSKA